MPSASDLVFLTGGTGLLGSDLISLLKRRGQRVRVLARSPGRDPEVDWVRGDLATGEGLRGALEGVRTVVHAATWSPVAQRGSLRMGDLVHSPPDVDVIGTRRLLDEAGRVDVEHFLYVSIVGVQEARLPYARRKAKAERLVRASGLDYSIVAATGFYWLLARLFDHLTARRLWMLPSNFLMEPSDSAEFAAYLMECIAEGPRGVRESFAGPERMSLVEAARAYQRARGLRRPIVPLHLPALALHAAGAQIVASGRRGTTTWAAWLEQHVRRGEPAAKAA